GDGIALSGSGGVLDEIAATGTIGCGIGQQFPDGVQLVIPREDQITGFAALVIFLLDELDEILDDPGEAVAGEYLFPEIVRLDAGWIRGISGTVVVPLVE